MITFKNISLLAVLMFIILGISSFFVRVSFLWYIFVFLVWLVITIIGSFSPGWNYHLHALISNPTISTKKIAITFDDGPNSQFTPEILKILSKYNAKATFFCIGHQVEKHPEVLKSIVSEGHLAGNHSYTHNYFINFKSMQGWITELQKTDEVIERVTGIKATLFRPPFGVTTPHLAKAIKISGHRVIAWNIRSFDTVLKNPEVIVKRLTHKVKPGSVILLHDNHPKIVYILERLLQFLQENDYQMVTINQLLHEK